MVNVIDHLSGVPQESVYLGHYFPMLHHNDISYQKLNCSYADDVLLYSSINSTTVCQIPQEGLDRLVYTVGR